MDLNLKGKRALVTGGSKGMGKASAQVLAEEGCEVMIASRDAQALQAAANEIKAATGAEVKCKSVDLSRHGATEELAARAGDLDIVLNHAGAIPGGGLAAAHREFATRMAIGLFALALAVAGAPPAQAQKWPEKPVRTVLAYPAGGNSDVATRVIAPKLQEILGQPFLVENKPGAGGMIAGELVAKSAPDGYTLFVTANGPILFSPMVFGRSPYLWHRDFVAVGSVSFTSLVLVASPSVPVKTVAELVALAKTQPGRLTMASGGVATGNHLLSELLQMASGASWITVQYKGGAPLMNDLLGGQVQFAFDQVSTSLPHVRSGKLRALAVATAKRVAMMPEVPTFAEAGYEAIEGETFTGIFAPAGTPREIVLRLSAALEKVLQDKIVIERFAAMGADARASTPEAFTEYLHKEYAKWTPVIKRANIRAE